ncbi:MAG: AAA family ATPase [Methanosarcinales archaeon]|nr:AAA family ATPase [Methanosarcinales archaeon]
MRSSISSIKFTNYRQYKGIQTLDFKMDPNKNVAIILGKNGAGKSNILNAITWCLYGIEVHKDDDIESDGMPIINTTEIAGLENNQSTYAEVIIQLDTDIGLWNIKRKIEGTKDYNGTFKINQNSHLTVIHPVGNQDKIDEGEDTQLFINNLLPEALRSFFFMDGEKLREFFEVSDPEKIAKAIDIVSQLDLVYNSYYNLEMFEKSLRKNVKATTPKLQDVQRNIQSLQEQIEKIKDKIYTEKEIINENNIELKLVKNYLKNNSNLNVSNLENERQTIEDEIKNFKILIHSLELDRNGYLVDIAPFIYLQKTLKQSYAIIEDKVEKGELPPRIKETFIRELLENGRCICGNDLTEEARNELIKYSEKLTLSELSEISIIGKTTVDDLLNNIKLFPEKIDKYNDNIDNLKDQLEQKQRRKEQISIQLKEHDVAEIKRNEERRDELNRLIAKSENNLKYLSVELDSRKKMLDEQKIQEEKELSKDRKNLILKNKLFLVQKGLEALSETEKIIKLKIKNQVEKNMNHNFFTLIRKKSAFSKISIDDEYSVKVQHIDGYNVINDLSAGEYLILGLSFMSALMNISGFQAPVLIDTPLGKIDDEHREYITNELPKFLKGTQLILLVTPTEYDEKVKSNLNKYLIEKNFYEISENEIQTESMVGQNVH